jgi:S1-C subfamily serine protease
VDGERVAQAQLASGDLLEVGENGPFLRFRLHRGPERPYKTIPEALGDCVDCARQSGAGWFGRLAILFSGLPREILTQTGPASRTVAAVVLIALTASILALALQGWALRRRVEADASMLQEISALLEQSEQNSLTEQELERIRVDLEAQLAERLEALEERSLDARRIISDATRSIVLLQGAYGFAEPESGRLLRVALSPDGASVRGPGGLLLGVDGQGPEYQRQFTGTAFVASEEGLLLTNRHLAVPWNFDGTARALVQEGWLPRMSRFIGYLPGIVEPFELHLVLSAGDVDLAVLCCSPLVEGVEPLELSDSLAAPGEEVVVLSYPTGIQALLARTDPAFVDSIMNDSDRDFWSVAHRLSEAGHIAPLATKGIVGQSSATAVVYDAETTRGSSGGPVLDGDGLVQALNVAVMREFGGSNLGVPASEARALLGRAKRLYADSLAAVDSLASEETVTTPSDSLPVEAPDPTSGR